MRIYGIFQDNNGKKVCANCTSLNKWILVTKKKEKKIDVHYCDDCYKKMMGLK
jgi:hypothetical protein